jgi:sugar phosphate isomerase/epimerase
VADDQRERTVDRMRTGVCISTQDGELARRALQTAIGLGCDSIELPVDRQLLDRWSATGASHDVVSTVVSVECVSACIDAEMILDVTVPYDERVRYASAQAEACFQFARETGSPNVRLSFPCPDLSMWYEAAGCRIREQRWDILAAVISPVLRRAKALGLRILFEPQAREMCPDAQSIRYLFRKLGDFPDVRGICHDPANLWILGYDSGEFLDEVQSMPAVVHVKDVQVAPSASADAEGEGWRHYGPQRPVRYRELGRGDMDWPSILRDLIGRGFEGPFLVEPQLSHGPEQTLEREWRWLQQQLASVHAQARDSAGRSSGGTPPPESRCRRPDRARSQVAGRRRFVTW